MRCHEMPIVANGLGRLGMDCLNRAASDLEDDENHTQFDPRWRARLDMGVLRLASPILMTMDTEHDVDRIVDSCRSQPGLNGLSRPD